MEEFLCPIALLRQIRSSPGLDVLVGRFDVRICRFNCSLPGRVDLINSSISIIPLAGNAIRIRCNILLFREQSIPEVILRQLHSLIMRYSTSFKQFVKQDLLKHMKPQIRPFHIQCALDNIGAKSRFGSMDDAISLEVLQDHVRRIFRDILQVTFINKLP